MIYFNIVILLLSNREMCLLFQSYYSLYSSSYFPWTQKSEFNFLLCLSSVLFPLFCYKIKAHYLSKALNVKGGWGPWWNHVSSFLVPDWSVVGVFLPWPQQTRPPSVRLPQKNINLYHPRFLHLHFFLSLISATAISTMMSSFFPTPILLLGICTSQCSHGYSQSEHSCISVVLSWQTLKHHSLC